MNYETAERIHKALMINKIGMVELGGNSPRLYENGTYSINVKTNRYKKGKKVSIVYENPIDGFRVAVSNITTDTILKDTTCTDIDALFDTVKELTT